MKKYFLNTLILMNFIFSNASFGQTASSHEIEVLARIQTVDHFAVNLIRLNEKDVIPSLLQDKSLEKVISELDPGHEALVKGHITYHASNVEGDTKLKPVFIIESIKPVSLKRLGKIDDFEKNEPPYMEQRYDQNFSPLTIPVTTEVASAITLTTTVLLMQSLTANASQPQPAQQLNSGLFLFAGAMATGIFIYEQIRGTKIK